MSDAATALLCATLAFWMIAAVLAFVLCERVKRDRSEWNDNR